MSLDNLDSQQRAEKRSNFYLHDFFVSELSWQSFGFGHTKPSDFVESQWRWMKPWMFTVYRALLSVGFLVWITFDLPREIRNYFHNKTYIWFVYATNWAFGLLTLVFFLLAIYCLVYNCPRGRYEIILYQPLWLVYTVALDAIVIVSLVFWVALANSDLGVFSSIWGKMKHSLAACLAVMDFFIGRIPVRLAHVVYILLIGLFYALFSYFFWLGNQEGPLGVGQVYPGLNWNHPRTAILSSLCTLLFSFLVHILIYVIYFFRTKISACFNDQQPVEITEDIEKDYANLEGHGIEQEAVSANSVSTWMEDRSNRHYGTVE